MNAERGMETLASLVAGYGEKIITPPLGVDLTGYGYYLDRRAESVLGDLKVRVLFLRKNADRIVLISCDLLGLTVEFSDKVRKEIALQQNLAIANVLLACIHTHSGPASQSLRGCGAVKPDYLTKLVTLIKEAVASAVANQEEAEFSCGVETIEPIGFNRRNGNFEPIDPLLKFAVFKRRSNKIYLVNYACHPVTLGPTKAISADWPGALTHEIEEKGNHGIFFQGFCGDIDPVVNKNRWGAGTEEDLHVYGKLLSQRIFKTEKFAISPPQVTLKAREMRIRLPLQVLQKEEIERERQFWLEFIKNNEPFNRFIQAWAEEANERYEEFKASPYLDSIPVQGVSIGDLKILGVPGEVFCQYGLNLQKVIPLLFTFGYSGGNICYLPTKDAYQNPNDYACYLAPKLYGLFPFSPEVETIFLESCKRVITEL